MHKKNIITLTQAERHQLKQLIAGGHGPARQLAHARILLKADQGPEGPGLPDAAIAQAVEVSLPTIQRVRQRFVQEGLEAALHRRLPRVPKARKLDGGQEAHLIALACSEPPAGQVRWTLRLLADKMVELAYIDSVSYGTVRRVLKKTNSNHG